MNTKTNKPSSQTEPVEDVLSREDVLEFIQAYKEGYGIALPFERARVISNNFIRSLMKALKEAIESGEIEKLSFIDNVVLKK
jgi:hypothetical protein